jgi:site-specific DNA-methyltransferase (adenine-specific)
MIEPNTILNISYKEGIEMIDDNSIDLVVTDPPYLFNKQIITKDYEGTTSKFARSELYLSEGKMLKDLNGFGEKEIDEFLSMLPRIMKKMNAYIFCSEAQIMYYQKWAQDHKYKSAILAWEKPLSIINKNRFSQNIEFIVRIYQLGCALNRLDESELYNRVDHSKIVQGKKKIHPTQKPISIYEKFIKVNSKDDAIILDPFIGSGTMAIAAMKNGRKYIGFESNNEYFDGCMKRIEEWKKENGE